MYLYIPIGILDPIGSNRPRFHRIGIYLCICMCVYVRRYIYWNPPKNKTWLSYYQNAINENNEEEGSYIYLYNNFELDVK